MGNPVLITLPLVNTPSWRLLGRQTPAILSHGIKFEEPEWWSTVDRVGHSTEFSKRDRNQLLLSRGDLRQSPMRLDVVFSAGLLLSDQ